ncbi:MAG: L-threonylcarbamoyladenylate synthase [Gammaproteobacteria bacterium]
MPTTLHIRQAVHALRKGGIIAYPTEAVFGLGCDPLNAGAVAHLLALKNRPLSKGLILIASDLKQVQPFLQPINNTLNRQLNKTWPGHVTWLLPTRPECPYWLTGNHPTLAVRLSAHPVCQALCNAWGGAIVSTSANASTRPPIRHRARLQREFSKPVDFIVPGDLGTNARPSIIYDSRNYKIIRA